MIIVSDTSSLNALHKIGQIALLPTLFRQVLIPEKVHAEMLRDPHMSTWLERFPDWLMVAPYRTISGIWTCLLLWTKAKRKPLC